MLSWILLEGEAIPRDVAEARCFALRAATQGVATAMTRMGMLYHNALGIDRDSIEAIRWWRRGAEAGDADGQAMLGAALHLGSGSERDPIEAFVWLTRAAKAGSRLAAPFFDAVRASLSAEDLAEAQRRAERPVKTVEPGA